MGQTTEEELLEQLRHGTKQGRILGNKDFIIGMDHCDFSLSDFTHYFNRNMPSMSRLVKDVRIRLTKSQSMHERMEHIKDQITTITWLLPFRVKVTRKRSLTPYAMTPSYNNIVLHDYFESAEGGGRLSLTLAKAIGADLAYGFKVRGHQYFENGFPGKEFPVSSQTKLPIFL